MIKFFRHIRKSLIMENKASKYFKYAIGEIILVVIGILIALQINNWNENRKNQIKEAKFIESFKNDLLVNKTELNRVIEKSEITSKISDSILKLQRGELDDFNIEVFVSCVMNATGFTVYKTQEGTIKDIMGSGQLDVIQNDSIRLAIGSWEANLKDLREWEKLEKTATDSYYKYLQQHIDIYKFDQDEFPINEKIKNQLLQDRIFLNYITDRENLPRILNKLYKNEMVRLNALLKLINTELDNY